MVHQERLEIGEKCFVSGIMAVLALEAGLTVITLGIHFSWLGLLLGVVGFCLVLGLANRLYAGSLLAHRIALGWIGFQIVYAGYALVLLAGSAHAVETAKEIGAPVAWAVSLKLLAYLSLGWILVRMSTVSDFFAVRRGVFKQSEPSAPIAPMAPTPAVPLTLTADQNEGVRGLAKNLGLAAWALVVLGFVQIVSSVVVYSLAALNPEALMVLGQGMLTAVLGVILIGPANEFRPLSNPQGQNKESLLKAFAGLINFYKAQVIIGLSLAVVLVARFVIKL